MIALGWLRVYVASMSAAWLAGFGSLGILVKLKLTSGWYLNSSTESGSLREYLVLVWLIEQ